MQSTKSACCVKSYRYNFSTPVDCTDMGHLSHKRSHTCLHLKQADIKPKSKHSIILFTHPHAHTHIHTNSAIIIYYIQLINAWYVKIFYIPARYV